MLPVAHVEVGAIVQVENAGGALLIVLPIGVRHEGRLTRLGVQHDRAQDEVLLGLEVLGNPLTVLLVLRAVAMRLRSHGVPWVRLCHGLHQRDRVHRGDDHLPTALLVPNPRKLEPHRIP